MKLHELKPTDGSKKRRIRVGRGDGSGKGGTCGRGEKGQMSRSGASHRPYFEGGQITFFRRLPKRGFKSMNHVEYNLVNVNTLEAAFEANDVVDLTVLREKHLIRDNKLSLKILGNGEISKALTVRAAKFSATAKAKIEAAGGTCEVV
ncbi:50S ribosomal protein L15 [Lentisphaerota bacterium WC36G]|nr:50S ribosomal protein L15 [Lentisphaerae bacterium WC36]